MKQPKPKKCKNELCKKLFTPTVSTTQVTCLNWECAVEYDKQKRAKKVKKEHTVAKREYKLNHKATQTNLAQKAFNRYIRLRDSNLPCISCGTTNHVIYCAGHFRTRGAVPALRFDEFNVNKQCNKRCNLELSGNIAGYRDGLIAKYGQDKLEWLEGHHEPKKYTADDYVEIKLKYLKLCREMEAS